MSVYLVDLWVGVRLVPEALCFLWTDGPRLLEAWSKRQKEINARGLQPLALLWLLVPVLALWAFLLGAIVLGWL